MVIARRPGAAISRASWAFAAGAWACVFSRVPVVRRARTIAMHRFLRPAMVAVSRYLPAVRAVPRGALDLAVLAGLAVLAAWAVLEGLAGTERVFECRGPSTST